MPDREKLRVGDRIRLLSVPEFDLEQRERELVAGHENAGWTADTIERILAHDPVVTISQIDEFAMPWFEVELPMEGGEAEFHWIAIMDDDSWEYC